MQKQLVLEGGTLPLYHLLQHMLPVQFTIILLKLPVQQATVTVARL
jgi:hypothetical protein